MKQKTNLRYSLALLCFLLSSAIIYNPLYKTSRPVLCSILCVMFGLILSVIYSLIFSKITEHASVKGAKKLLCAAGIISVSLGIVFFISALIDCFAFFSPFYASSEKGIVFAVLLLFACAYASRKNSNGIFRLCQLICPMFILYYITLFLAPLSTKTLILPQRNSFFGVSSEGLFQGLVSGLYLFSDIAVFHFVFDSEKFKTECKNNAFAKTSFTTVIIFGIIMCINRIRASFTFGETLVSGFSYCDLASIKLMPLFSFPEIYLLFITLSCIVKAAVYIRAASKLLYMIAGKNTNGSFKYASFICACLSLILSCIMTRLMSSVNLENTLFIPFLFLSSFFITWIAFVSSKRQNKS